MALLFFFFSSNLWSIYASMLFYVSRDHHHFSYGKGSSKLQIFTLPHTDPARLFCRKSLRCATNKSTKNLGCASAILSILASLKCSPHQQRLLFCQWSMIFSDSNITAKFSKLLSTSLASTGPKPSTKFTGRMKAQLQTATTLQ